MQNKLLIILLFSVNVSFAQLSSFDYNGYTKYLFSSVQYPIFNERFNDHLIHLRLNTRWYPAQSLTAALEFRTRFFYGGSVENIPFYSNLVKSKQGLVNLDVILWDKKKTVGYAEIDRLWLDYVKDNWQLTVGRQRIAWGTSWAWNPIDLFNPKEVLDFDYEEMPGADAVRIQYYTGPVTKVELAVSPGKDKADFTAAGLISFNQWNYDFNLIAGYKKERWVFGGGWVGDIIDAGFRGEVLISQAPKQEYDSPFFQLNNIEPLTSDNLYGSLVISGDYTFPNSFYIHTELLFNSNGTNKNASVYQKEAIRLDMLTPARWSIFQEFAYQFTPLLRGVILGIFNPDDKSYVIVPSATYSLITDLDLYLTGFIFGGSKFSEFGDSGSSIFVRVKFSF
ncbi:MAG: hypothetical protein KGZ85_11685 [Ignavibacterium sp.]|nr:hypothetical protein [Ignavibacterium sp.]